MKCKICLVLLILIITSFIWSCHQKTRLKNMLCGPQGFFWDIVYIEGKYKKNSWQGYHFRVDGKYYAYLYEDGKRRPFLIAPHSETPPTIEANLRNWSIEEDSLLFMLGAGTYFIEKISRDSLFLVLKSEYRPLIKLAKVKE